MQTLKEHERYECIRKALDKIDQKDRTEIKYFVDVLTSYAKSKNMQLSDDGALLVLAAVGMSLNGKRINTTSD